MKKISSFIIIFFILSVIAWPFLQKQIVSLEANNRMDFKNVKVLKTDEKGAMYLVTGYGDDESIIKMDKSGGVIKTYRLKASNISMKTLISDLYIDGDENLYILYLEYSQDQSGPYFASVARLDGSWNSSKLLLRQEMGSYENIRDFKFAHMSDDGTDIYGGWVHKGIASVFKSPIVNNAEVTMIYEYKLDSLPKVYEMLVIPQGAVLFSSIEGKVYYESADGKAIQAYPADREESIAVGLCSNGNGGAYFFDAFSKKYISISSKLEVQTVIENGFVLNKDNGITLSGLNNIYTSKDGRFTAVADGASGFRLVNGGFSFVTVVESRYVQTNNKPYIYIIGIVIMVILITLLLWDFFCKIMRMQMSILLKQSFGLLSAILVIMVFLLTNVSENVVRSFLLDGYKSHLVNLGAVLTNEMSAQKAGDLKVPSDTGSSIYASMAQAAEKDVLKDQKTLKGYSNDITYSLYRESDKAPVSVFSSSILPVMFPVNYLDMDHSRKDLINDSLARGEALFASVSQDTGEWLYMAMPVTLNNSGNAILEVGMSIEDYTERYETLKRLFSYIVLGIALIVFIIILATIISTLASIRKLSSGVEKIADGHFDVRVNVNTGDEIEHLSRKFNDMASFIENYTRKLAELNKSYYRFIPERFISMLGVESIEKVSIRDHVKEDMAVMHFNVRSFFEIASNMKSEDIFKFINGVFERFTPIVQDFGGIIDRFMDTGFTAVFPESPENAVNAALRIQEKLAAWNMERTKENSTKVNIGVVLHYGTVMLGVIGDGARLSSAAVSQCLHIAANLEEYGSKSNISVLATDEIVRNIPSGVFKKRYIGVVGYNSNEIDIYDFFEGDEYSIRERKETSMENFNNGVLNFKKGDYYKARALFIDVMRILPEDGAARRYLFLSDEYYHKKETRKSYYVI